MKRRYPSTSIPVQQNTRVSEQTILRKYRLGQLTYQTYALQKTAMETETLVSNGPLQKNVQHNSRKNKRQDKEGEITLEAPGLAKAFRFIITSDRERY